MVGEAQQAGRSKWDAFWEAPVIVPEATHVAGVRRALELMAPSQRSSRPRRVLDLGCGAGRAMRLLTEAGCEVVGVDLAEQALRRARADLGPAAWLVQGDAFRLSFATGSFDAIVSLGYASVGSYPGVQPEMARVLRPGGLALVDFRQISLYHLPLVPWRGRQFLRVWQRGELALPGLGLRPAAHWRLAGFRLQAIRPFNTFPPLGDRLSLTAALAFERSVGRILAPVLARTVLALFRRVET
jgi:SAM-dependent methyltransferase